ncbi:MAG: DUF4251 domain-containing protein [Tannerella sp.]|jgi:hypothetical protein|nr:DUF4251 domain-containing protein [Tannerella sp.]
MKTIRLFLTGGMMLLLTLGFFSCKSSGIAAGPEKKQAVKELIDSKHYTVDVNRMLPMSGKTQNLTSNYSLTVEGDSVISYLPYSGRAYSVPYGGGKGLNFNAKITDYSLSYDQKGTADISFLTDSGEDRYKYSVKIFANGSSVIQVTPNNRQSISYHGNLNEDEKP